MGLTLGRRVGETIRIGENIFVTVVNATPGRIRLKIDAPRDVPVIRGEIDAEAKIPESECIGNVSIPGGGILPQVPGRESPT